MKHIIFLLFILCLPIFAQVSTYHWVTTDTIIGNGVQNSGPIKIYGTKWRLSYTSADKSKIFIYKTLLTDGSIYILNKKMPAAPAATTGSYNDSTPFYLTVKGHQNNWKVNVEQYMDKGLEWEWMKDSKAEPSEEIVAAWAGEKDATLSYEAKNEPCKLEFALASDGMCEIIVKDQNGTTISRHLILKKNANASTWLYRAGNYEINVQTNVPWTIQGLVPTK